MNLAEKFRMVMKDKMANQLLLLPPPPDLIQKSNIENEEFRSGAPIPFVKFGRLMGLEMREALNPNKGGTPEDRANSDIPNAATINDYMINAKEVGRLVYCRYGEKYMQDIEKRRSSNIASINQPINYASASYLINIKKLIEDYNMESDKKGFGSMKGMKVGGGGQPQQYYKL